MVEALGGAGHVGAGGVGRQRRLVAAEHEIAAHAGGEVDHDVDAGGADAVDDLAVELGVARRRCRSRDRARGCARRPRPPLAASIAESAICSGVTGTCGLLAVVSPAPVMAQVMKTSQFNGSLPSSRSSPVT